jgi:hypothetical protein
VQPSCHAIGRRLDLLTSNDGPVEGRLLDPTAVIDPGTRPTRVWLASLLDRRPERSKSTAAQGLLGQEAFSVDPLMRPFSSRRM